MRKRVKNCNVGEEILRVYCYCSQEHCLGFFMLLLLSVTSFASELFMRHGAVTILFALVRIAIFSILVLSVVVIITTVSLFMNDERRMRMWIRFKNVHDKSRSDHSKGRSSISRSSHVVNLDDDVKLLHSYVRSKRRHLVCDKINCDSDNSSIRHQHQLDIVSKEVQEWKKIQKDVKLQLTVLSKAVQQKIGRAHV